MSKPVVFVTSQIPHNGIQLLEKECIVRVNREKSSLSKQDIIDNIKDVQAILCLLKDTIDRDIIDAGHHLKIISNYAVGFDNIDVSYATSKGIMVGNTPGVLTETTAELTWALIFAVSRHIVPADRYLRQGCFVGWDPMLFLGSDIHGKTLGIIGMGRIGQAVACMASGFDMRILYYDNQQLTDIESIDAFYVSLDELAREADIITVHTPLTEKTFHLCDMDFFQQCKSNAIFINTSRGPVVDEKALDEALDKGIIAGAGLDVFEHEPDVYPGLLKRDNVVLLPHIGSATVETRTKMAVIAADNILDAIHGRTPQFLVNPEVKPK